MDNPPREAKCFFTSRQDHGSYRSEAHGKHTTLHAAAPPFNHEQKHRQLSSRPERGESFSLSPAPARAVEGSRECCLDAAEGSSLRDVHRRRRERLRDSTDDRDGAWEELPETARPVKVGRDLSTPRSDFW